MRVEIAEEDDWHGDVCWTTEKLIRLCKPMEGAEAFQVCVD
jgi:hypothetical protein